MLGIADGASAEPYGFDPLNTYKPVRDLALDVKLGTVSGNKVSAVSFDISSTTYLVDAGTFPTFTSTSSPGHATPLSALSILLNNNFNPTGTVERLVFRTVDQSVTYNWLKSTATGTTLADYAPSLSLTEAVSIGAEEVVLGVPTLSGNTLTVPVRLACQPTPSAGLTAVTTPQANVLLRLRTTFSSGSYAETSGTTDAYINVDLTGVPAHSLLQFRAWWDAPDGTGNWDEYQDAWATAQWAQNAVVWVKAGPDVANDQTLARGQFHFYRTGSLTSTQTVAFSLPVTGLKPATYGSTGTGDYTLVANAALPPSTWAMIGTTGGTLTFAANQAEAVLDVVPRSDTKLENNVVYLTVDPGTGYAVPDAVNTLTARSATVLIYDGPEFVLFQLDDYTPILAGYPTNTSAYRFADATAAYALDNNPTPKIAGGATYLADFYGPNQNFGGWWTTVTPFPLTDFWNDRVGFWQGFGAPSLGVSDDGTFVGQLGNNAFHRTTTGATINLPHLSAQNVSRAVGLNRGLFDPTGRYIVGSSRAANGIDRPVVWWAGEIPAKAKDLGENSPLLPDTGTGLALAANDSGIIVGQAELLVGGVKILRAFRPRESANANANALPLALALGDQLPLPAGTPNGTDNLSVARAVNTSDVGAIAVGSAIKKPFAIPAPSAVFWPARFTPSAANPAALLLKKMSSVIDTSDATAINDADLIGGWSKDASTSKATLWRGAATAVLAEDLNDPHVVKPGTSWSLEAFTAINNDRVIVGNGKCNGKPRGFVMVPLPAGN